MLPISLDNHEVPLKHILNKTIVIRNHSFEINLLKTVFINSKYSFLTQNEFYKLYTQSKHPGYSFKSQLPLFSKHFIK